MIRPVWNKSCFFSPATVVCLWPSHHNRNILLSMCCKITSILRSMLHCIVIHLATHHSMPVFSDKFRNCNTLTFRSSASSWVLIHSRHWLLERWTLIDNLWRMWLWSDIHGSSTWVKDLGKRSGDNIKVRRTAVLSQRAWESLVCI